jgi:hypothetical protein
VVTPAQHDVVIGQLASEKLQRGQVASGTQQTRIWQQTWSRLFAYLNAAEPRHLLFRVDTLEELRAAPAAACEFAAFHVLRFVFGEIMFGGGVSIARAANAVRLTINSPVFDLPATLPAWLTGLVQSLSNDGVGARLGWQRSAGDPHRATLDVTLGQA